VHAVRDQGVRVAVFPSNTKHLGTPADLKVVAGDAASFIGRRALDIPGRAALAT